MIDCGGMLLMRKAHLGCQPVNGHNICHAFPYVLLFQGVIGLCGLPPTRPPANGTERTPLAARGLKTKIAWNVALLLLLSAVITDALVVLVLQSLVIRHEVVTARKRIDSMGALYFSGNPQLGDGIDPRKDLATTLILAMGNFPALQIVDSGGTSLYRQTSDLYPVGRLADQIKTALRDGRPIIQEQDYAWQIFWWHPQVVYIAVPIFSKDQIQGVIAAILPMTALQQQIERYHKPIYLYILINTVVLTIVGLYRIFRLYLRPIDRIVHQADDFHEDIDPFFSFRQEDDELQRLSSALNRMLNRISMDKKRLKESVISLERANAELQNAQKEIIRAEKMASVGRLAAGIAHEIGNPIGIVLGYLEMLKQNDLDENDKIDFLGRTEDEIQRINTVIRQLLDLARPKSTQVQLVSVHSAIQDVVEVMRMQPIMKDIRIDLKLYAEDDSIWGNEDQLRQVFLNLLLNAADAIHGSPGGKQGKITVGTEMGLSPSDNQRPCLRVMLCDNGAGIDPQQLQNIFDPFYTTKEPGKGTGLGLSVSYMIIDGLGGTISARNQAEQGASFEIELPFSRKTPSQ
jgi:two-component system, NtrC family, sensor kinase